MPKVRNLATPAPEIKQDAAEMFQWKPEISGPYHELIANSGKRAGFVSMGLSRHWQAYAVVNRTPVLIYDGFGESYLAKFAVMEFWRAAAQTAKEMGL